MYTKIEPGVDGYLVDYPQMCICGSQKGPMVATGRPPLGVPTGQVYLCRLCVTQSARALGMVKGDEHTRLQNAADELALAEREIATRQEIIDQKTATAGDQTALIRQLQSEVERLRGQERLRMQQANQILASAQEMAAV